MNSFLASADATMQAFVRVSWQAAVLTGVVLLIQWLVGSRMPAQIRSVLWLVVLVRFLLPVSPESSASLFNLVYFFQRSEVARPLDAEPQHSNRANDVAPVASRQGRYLAEPEPDTASPSRPASPPTSATPAATGSPRTGQFWHTFHWMRIAAVAWIAGVLATLARLVVLLVKLGAVLRRSREIVDPDICALFERCRCELGVSRAVCLVVSPDSISPAIAAGRRISLILPERVLAAFSMEELRLVLLHELAHVRRADLLVQWLWTLATTLHWFNPIAWLALFRMQSDRELACDEIVLAHLHPRERIGYGRAILKIVETLHPLTPLAAAVGACRGSSALTRRITMIANYRPASRMRGVWTGVLLSRFCLGGLTDAVGEPKSEKSAPAAVSAAPVASDASDPEQELVGKVITLRGKPVPREEITVYENGKRLARVLHSNESGQFRFPKSWNSEDAPTDTLRLLLVKSQGDALGWLNFNNRYEQAVWQSAAVNPQPLPPIHLVRLPVIPATKTASGRFLTSDGSPIPGIRVEVADIFHPQNGVLAAWMLGGEALLPAGVSDREGRFAVKLPSKTTAHLRPLHPDWVAKLVPIEAYESAIGDIVLAPAARVRGRVVDASTGNPVPAIRVAAQAIERTTAEPQDAVWGESLTDAAGRYLIGGLQPETYNILFLGNPQRPELVAPAHAGLTLTAGTQVQADFRVVTGRRLVGRVLDAATREPLPGIIVGYYGAARPISGAAQLSDRTKAEGMFEFLLPPGETEIYVSETSERDSNKASRRKLDMPADRDPDPVILTAGTLREYVGAEVDHAKTTDPIQVRRAQKRYEVKVVLQLPPGRDIFREWPDGSRQEFVEGRITYKGAERVSFWAMGNGRTFHISFRREDVDRVAQILIDAPGFPLTLSPEFAVKEGAVELPIDLPPEGDSPAVPVKGRVVDRSGRPLAGARSSMARMPAGHREPNLWGPDDHATDAAGRFEIKRVWPQEQFRLRIEKQDMEPTESTWIDVKNSEPLTLPDFEIGSL